VYPKCIKTHLRAFVISKFFPGVKPRTPVSRGGAGGVGWEGRCGVEREGWYEVGWEGRGREGRKGEGRGKEGLGTTSFWTLPPPLGRPIQLFTIEVTVEQSISSGAVMRPSDTVRNNNIISLKARNNRPVCYKRQLHRY
jgi:hypothetical protein